MDTIGEIITDFLLFEKIPLFFMLNMFWKHFQTSQYVDSDNCIYVKYFRFYCYSIVKQVFNELCQEMLINNDWPYHNYVKILYFLFEKISLQKFPKCNRSKLRVTVALWKIL